MDQPTDIKQDRTGITRVISKKPTPDGQPRRQQKKRGAGDTVGISLRLKKPSWLALHEAALDEETNVTQLILNWLDEHRRKRGLPPVKE